MDQKELNLINWCAQYLHQYNVFVDASANNGNFTLFLHDKCKYVYCYEPLYINLEHIMKKVDAINIIWCSNTLNLRNIKNIGFIKLCHLPLETCANIIGTLTTFPPILFDNIELQILLKVNGYKVYPINGYDGIFLASDHSDYHQERLSTYEQLVFDNYASEIEINNALLREIELIKPITYTDKYLLNCPMGTLMVPNNPCIIKTECGYLCNIRASNYIYNPNFVFLDKDNIHRSDHYHLTLNEDFLIQDVKKLIDVTNNVYYPSFVVGIDDLRMINDKWFICSHGNFNNRRLIEQCLGKVDDGNVISLVALKGPNPSRHEKNWLPFMKGDDMYVIYLIHPFTIYLINKEDGTLVLVKEVVLNDLNMKNFRGSAGPIPYKNGWLATVHQVANLHYMHRFVWFDEAFTKIKVSEPFYFERKGIEFNPGMTTHKDGIVLSYSVLDNNAKCITVSHDTITSYLKI